MMDAVHDRNFLRNKIQCYTWQYHLYNFSVKYLITRTTDGNGTIYDSICVAVLRDSISFASIELSHDVVKATFFVH